MPSAAASRTVTPTTIRSKIAHFPHRRRGRRGGQGTISYPVELPSTCVIHLLQGRTHNRKIRKLHARLKSGTQDQGQKDERKYADLPVCRIQLP